MIREVDGSPIEEAVWGRKASGLAKLVAMGLPVPPALCLRPGAAAGPRGALVIERWLNNYPGNSYVLRSSSLLEDLDETAGAGISTTLVGIAGDYVEVQAAIIDQIEPTLIGGSIILQVQANCRYAGVAFVDDDLVTVEGNLRSVTATTSGETPELTATVSVTRLALRFERSMWSQPIIGALRQVATWSRLAAEVYGGRADVEWVHDGLTCQVVQVRPLTRPLVT